MTRLLFLLVLAFPLLADDVPMTRLRVEVQSKHGKPIERASVVVKFVQGRSAAKLGKKVIKNWEIRTNQEGIAQLPSIPQGQVKIQVIAKGYQTFGDIFDIDEEEKTVEVVLNPPQKQYSSHDN